MNHEEILDSSTKVLWNGNWIVEIIALEGAESTPDILVDQVRDALAVHRKTLEQP